MRRSGLSASAELLVTPLTPVLHRDIRLCSSLQGNCDIPFSFKQPITPEVTSGQAGCMDERIDPLRFLDGCRKRQLNHVLSVLCLSTGYYAPYCFPFSALALLVGRHEGHPEKASGL